MDVGCSDVSDVQGCAFHNFRWEMLCHLPPGTIGLSRLQLCHTNFTPNFHSKEICHLESTLGAFSSKKAGAVQTFPRSAATELNRRCLATLSLNLDSWRLPHATIAGD